jgi:hypothetical protein
MSKIYDIALGVFVFLTAIAYHNGQTFAETQGIIFKVGIPILFILALYLKPKRWIINPLLNLVPTLALLSTLFVPKEVIGVSIVSFVYVFLGICLFYLVANYLENANYILNALCGVVIITTIMCVLQITNHDPICFNDSKDPNFAMVGLFGFKYVFGAYMAIITPILLIKRRFFGIISGILCICSLSWACIGLMISACLFMLYHRSKFHFKIAIIPILLLTALLYWKVLYKPDNYILNLKYKINSRLELESKFLKMLCHKPITGYGIGTFPLLGPQIVNNHNGNWGNMIDAWNDYLERGIEMGWGAIVLMLWLFIDSFKRFFRSKKDPNLIGLASSLAIIPFGIVFHDYFIHFSLTTMIIVIYAMYHIKIGELNG